jgi:hypothetical protein
MTKTTAGILAIIALAFIGYTLFTLGNIKADSSFKAKIDSLTRINDSLAYQNTKDNEKIHSLKALDSALSYEIEHQKIKVIKIDHWIDSSKSKIDTYTEKELVSSFNKRYPKDTLTNPLPLAQPVLIATAKDLVELDGSKEKLIIKDSIIAIQESRISFKDSTITLYVNKEGRYKAIIDDKDLAISEWNKQYKLIQAEDKKLKLQSKFQKIGTAIIAGGLIYTLIHK